MADDTKNPVALAGADRADVTVLSGKDDFDVDTGGQRERQASHLLKFYAISRPVAIVIAELAFDPGRRSA